MLDFCSPPPFQKNNGPFLVNSFDKVQTTTHDHSQNALACGSSHEELQIFHESHKHLG